MSINNEIRHKKQNDVIKLLSLNMNIGLYGPAGSGKSTLIQHYCEDKLIPYYIIPCGPMTMISDIIGGIDLHGNIIETALGKYCDKPGIIVFEEIDLLNSKVQNQLNLVLQERRLVIEGKDVEKKLHPNFQICATANTDGQVEVGGHDTRSESDLSLLSRFFRVFIPIDTKIETKLATREDGQVQNELLDLIRAIRIGVKKNQTKDLISPRQTKDLTKLSNLFTPQGICKNFFDKLPNGAEMVLDEEIYELYRKYLNKEGTANPDFVHNLPEEAKPKPQQESDAESAEANSEDGDEDNEIESDDERNGKKLNTKKSTHAEAKNKKQKIKATDLFSDD